MARRRTSALESIVDVASMFPWWVGVLVAVLAYLGFHLLAEPKVFPPAHDAGDLARMATAQALRIVALLLQYLVPFAALVGATVSLRHRRRASTLHDNLASSPDRGTLSAMSWQEFEVLIGEVFRRRGYKVIERGGGGPDGGVDLELQMEGDRYLVQCKHWRATSVGVATVRELYGVMAAEGATGGFVVCAGKFTADAHRFAEGRSIRLFPAAEVLAMVRANGNPQQAAIGDSAPACPVCGGHMRLRRPRRRPNEPFWGCSKYPTCRGTVNISRSCPG